jgi:hypothetical protein
MHTHRTEPKEELKRKKKSGKCVWLPSFPFVFKKLKKSHLFQKIMKISMNIVNDVTYKHDFLIYYEITCIIGNKKLIFTITRKQNLFFAGHAANGAFGNFSKSTIGLYRPV